MKFFDWSYRHGLKMAERLDYVPMPAKVVRMVGRTWAREIKDRSGNPVWTVR